jgi:hypothetical protein
MSMTPHTFHEAAALLSRSFWTRVVRRLTDGHTETWYLTTNFSPPAAPLAELVRLNGLLVK